jgi:polygalacturonase
MTKVVQKAINRCSRTGGTILFKKGEYTIGTIYMKSNVKLELDSNTIIKASKNIHDYPDDTHKQMYRNESHMDRCLFFARDCINITITGGVFDGNGGSFTKNRPMMFRYLNCQNIRIYNVTMLNPASWTNAFIQCKNIWVSGVNISSRANENGDGLDFDACRDVFVSNSNFNCSDDCICVQNSTTNQSAESIFVSNCLFESRWAGIRIGLLSTNPIRNIFISNCSFKNIDCSGLKIQSAEGSVIENVFCDNLMMSRVRRPFFITANRFRENVDLIDQPIKTPSIVRNITIKNVVATTHNNNELPNCMIVDAGHEDIIENIKIKEINYCVYGRESSFEGQISYHTHKRAEAFNYEGGLPASGLFVRNVTNMLNEDIRITCIYKDAKAKIYQE